MTKCKKAGSILLLFTLAGCRSGMLPGTRTPDPSRVQPVVAAALEGYRKGGGVEVIGVQDGGANECRADLQFNGFQYNANTYGIPLPKNYQAPREPSINSPSFYQEMYRASTQGAQNAHFSGRGTAFLTRYNNGRWVLSRIAFNFIDISANAEIW
jgi:hypothetical protein